MCLLAEKSRVLLRDLGYTLREITERTGIISISAVYAFWANTIMLAVNAWAITDTSSGRDAMVANVVVITMPISREPVASLVIARVMGATALPVAPQAIPMS